MIYTNIHHLKFSAVLISLRDLLSSEGGTNVKRTSRPMAVIAILKLGIQNELRLNPLPVQAPEQSQ